MPAPASGRSPSLTSPSTAAPRRWPGARVGVRTPCWAGCTPTTPPGSRRARVPPHGRPPSPFCPQRQAELGEAVCAALHRRKLSWKKAKKLLSRADPERRQAFIEQLQGVLAGAQRDQHLLVYLDEAHIHQDCDLGYGWGERGQRFWIASRSPGLSARVSFYGLYLSFYGLYLYNEGQV